MVESFDAEDEVIWRLSKKFDHKLRKFRIRIVKIEDIANSGKEARLKLRMKVISDNFPKMLDWFRTEIDGKHLLSIIPFLLQCIMHDALEMTNTATKVKDLHILWEIMFWPNTQVGVEAALVCFVCIKFDVLVSVI
jgi:hypothetical protein